MLKNCVLCDLTHQFNTTDSFCCISSLLVFNKFSFSSGLTCTNLNRRGKDNPGSAVPYTRGGPGLLAFKVKALDLTDLKWLTIREAHAACFVCPSEHPALPLRVGLCQQMFFPTSALFQWRAHIIFNLALLWHNFNSNFYFLGYVKCIFEWEE